MATQKSTQAAPAASVNNSSTIAHSPGAAFGNALALLKEIDDEQQRVFSLAVAGEKHLDVEEFIGKDLFRLVQRLTESAELTRDLRKCVEDLAESAGVRIEAQA